jgi:ADP-heptose:LPS heptosyltransferase
MRSLRAALPETHITLIGLPWARHFVERFGEYLDEFIEFPGFPGFLEQPARIEQLPKFLSDIQQRRFDLALQMQGSGCSALARKRGFTSRANSPSFTRERPQATGAGPPSGTQWLPMGLPRLACKWC